MTRFGDCRDSMRAMIAEGVRVQMCVTSPPYWGLRDYGHPGQLGLEPTPAAYVANMVEVFGLVRQLLADDGTLWLNLGSSFCSGIIESPCYVIKRSFPHAERRQIAQALSQVWGGNASAESAMQGLLAQGIRATGKLRNQKLPEVRAGVHETQSADGEILLSQLREVGQSHAETCSGSFELHDLPQTVGAIPRRHAEKPGQERVLQQGVLAQLQPKGQSLPLDRGTGSAHESGRCEVAQGGVDEGQIPLPNLPCYPEARGAPHPPVRDAQSAKVGSQQRSDAVSVLPPQDATPGNGARGDIDVHGVGACHGLEDLTFPKSAIPPSFLAWCEPEYIYKQKDLINIPVMVAEALRRDGLYLRSEIIWSKPSPMPESVRDRPTKSHEQIFLLSKRATYYYDADAIAEPMTTDDYRRPYGSPGANALDPRGRQGNGELRRYTGQATKDYDSANAQDPSATKARIVDSILAGDITTRNKRSVWTVTTKPYADAHFATFPPELIEPCILAGSRPGDTVLDPFLGSGTVGQVAQALGRKWLGCELNRDYEPLILDRTAQSGMVFA